MCLFSKKCEPTGPEPTNSNTPGERLTIPLPEILTLSWFTSCSFHYSKFSFDDEDPDKSRKMQRRAARFADTLDNKKLRSTPLALQINQYVRICSKYSLKTISISIIS